MAPSIAQRLWTSLTARWTPRGEAVCFGAVQLGTAALAFTAALRGSVVEASPPISPEVRITRISVKAPDFPSTLQTLGFTSVEANAASVAWPGDWPTRGSTLELRRLPDSTRILSAWQGASPITILRARPNSAWQASEREPRWSHDLVMTTATVEPNSGVDVALHRAVGHAQGAAWIAEGLALGVTRLARSRGDAQIAEGLRGGTHVAVLFERRTALHDQRLQDVDAIHAVRITPPRSLPWTMLRFVGPNGRVDYFDPRGSSPRAGHASTPLHGARVSRPFARWRRHPVLGVGRPHNGTDFAAPYGAPVRATMPGVVEYVGWSGGFGLCVILRHPKGVTTTYGHLSRATRLRVGQIVRQQTVIGAVGQTGLATAPHLHYEVRINNRPVDPTRTALRFRNARQIPAQDWSDWNSWRQSALDVLQHAMHRPRDSAWVVAHLDSTEPLR